MIAFLLGDSVILLMTVTQLQLLLAVVSLVLAKLPVCSFSQTESLMNILLQISSSSFCNNLIRELTSYFCILPGTCWEFSSSTYLAQAKTQHPDSVCSMLMQGLLQDGLLIESQMGVMTQNPLLLASLASLGSSYHFPLELAPVQKVLWEQNRRQVDTHSFLSLLDPFLLARRALFLLLLSCWHFHQLNPPTFFCGFALFSGDRKWLRIARKEIKRENISIDILKKCSLHSSKYP